MPGYLIGPKMYIIRDPNKDGNCHRIIYVWETCIFTIKEFWDMSTGVKKISQKFTGPGPVSTRNLRKNYCFRKAQNLSGVILL